MEFPLAMKVFYCGSEIIEGTREEGEKPPRCTLPEDSIRVILEYHGSRKAKAPPPPPSPRPGDPDFEYYHPAQPQEDD